MVPRTGPNIAFIAVIESKEASPMKYVLTISALLPLAVVGLVLMTVGSAADDEVSVNPCPDSFAIYVDEQLVECMNSKQKYKAYP